MRQAMFNLNTCSPDDERVTKCIKDFIFTAAPPEAFGWLTASHFDPFHGTLYTPSYGGHGKLGSC